MIRYAQTLSFFDNQAIGRSIFYEDLGTLVSRDGGLVAVTERIRDLIKERRPGIVVIDSFKALTVFARDAQEFRRFLHDLAALLSAFPATCFWVGEYGETRRGRRRSSPSPTAIISLTTERVSERTLRMLQVPKLRGSDFRSGRTPTGSRKTASRSSPGSPTRSRGRLPARRRARFDRARAARPYALRRLPAGQLDPRGRPLGRRARR